MEGHQGLLQQREGELMVDETRTFWVCLDGGPNKTSRWIRRGHKKKRGAKGNTKLLDMSSGRRGRPSPGTGIPSERMGHSWEDIEASKHPLLLKHLSLGF